MRSQQTVQLRPRKPHLRPPLLKTKLLKGSSTKRLPRASKSWRTKNSHAPKPSGRRSCVASALDARGWAFVPGGRLADWREACASSRMPLPIVAADSPARSAPASPRRYRRLSRSAPPSASRGDRARSARRSDAHPPPSPRTTGRARPTAPRPGDSRGHRHPGPQCRSVAVRRRRLRHVRHSRRSAHGERSKVFPAKGRAKELARRS